MTEGNETRRRLLRTLPIFAGSSDEELGRIDAIVDEIEVEPGEMLVREGDPGEESFIIVSGTADVRIGGTVVASLGPGTFFGEMALLEGRPRSATVTAKEAMRLLVVSGDDFPIFIEQPGVAVHMLRSIVARLRQAQERYDSKSA